MRAANTREDDDDPIIDNDLLATLSNSRGDRLYLVNTLLPHPGGTKQVHVCVHTSVYIIDTAGETVNNARPR